MPSEHPGPLYVGAGGSCHHLYKIKPADILSWVGEGRGNQFLRSVVPVDDPSPWSTWAPLIGPSQVFLKGRDETGGREGRIRQ